MNTYAERYNLKPAAAWLRGHSLKTGIPEIDPELLEMPLEVLTDAELATIVEQGRRAARSCIPLRPVRPNCPEYGRFWVFCRMRESGTNLTFQLLDGVL